MSGAPRSLSPTGQQASHHPGRIIVLDASPGGGATMARVGAVLLHTAASPDCFCETVQAGHDGIGAMATMLDDILARSGWTHPDLVAVSVGPGSFTGLRTACALAAGFAFGVGCPVIGVTRGEALAQGFADILTPGSGFDGWLAIYAARRGRWFIEGGTAGTLPLPAHAVDSAIWHAPPGHWLVAGDAAREAIAQSRPDALSSGTMVPAPSSEAALTDYAVVAARRAAGLIAPRAPLPLSVDKPEAALPAGGLRAAPQ